MKEGELSWIHTFLPEVKTAGCLDTDSPVHVCIPTGNVKSWEISNVDVGSESLSPVLCPSALLHGRYTWGLGDAHLIIYEVYILNLFANPW